MDFHEQLQEKYLHQEAMQGIYIYALNGSFLQWFRHPYGLHYCAFRHNLLNVLIAVGTFSCISMQLVESAHNG